MFVDRIYFPVTTLGPGERVVVWTCAARMRCPGCANPELWETRPEAAIEPARLAAVLNDLAGRTGAHRITFTAAIRWNRRRPSPPCSRLSAPPSTTSSSTPATPSGSSPPCPNYRKACFPSPPPRNQAAGGLPNEGSAGAAPSAHPEDAPLIDVLIDGPYVEAENDGVCALRGSTNQRVIVLNPALETLYHEEMQKPRSVQNAVFDGRAISIGIHGRPQTTREKE